MSDIEIILDENVISDCGYWMIYRVYIIILDVHIKNSAYMSNM